MKAIFDQLKKIAEDHMSYGYLSAYQNDLYVHDARTLSNAEQGQEYVWVLRSSGTELFPVRAGMDPVWCTFWLDARNACGPVAKCWHVTVTAPGGMDGRINPISTAEATRLAKLPHPEGKIIRFSLFASHEEARKAA